MPGNDSSDDARIDELESRLDDLERTVTELREAVETLAEDPAPPSDSEEDPPSPSSLSSNATRESLSEPSDASTEPSAASSTNAPSSSLRNRLHNYATTLGLRSEDWISYVGMGLLLFGLAFLFKHSIDQGWLTPTVRVSFGGLLGTLLFIGGQRRAADRPVLQQILFGGSSATFYGTVFAAYQLYGLFSYPVAFGGMVFVTVATIALALQQDHASTAFIGTAGGLGTPFLLFTQADGGASLALYTCLVVGGACAIYLYRGWRSVLILTTFGGWGVLLLASQQAPLDVFSFWNIAGLQLGVVIAWGLLGGTPLLRTVLRGRDPNRWPAASTPVASWLASVTGPHPTVSVTASPLLAFACTHALWPAVPDLGWAAGTGLFALLYGGLAWRLYGTSLTEYSPFHGLVSALFTTYSLSEALDGPALLLTWAVEAALLLVLARRLGHTLLRLAGYALYGVTLVWVNTRMAWETVIVSSSPEPITAAGELLVLGILVVALGGIRSRWLHRLYQVLLITGWFGWWGQVLWPLSHGSSLLLLVCALSAATLLALSQAWEAPVPRIAGHLVFGGLAYCLLLRLHTPAETGLPMLSIGALSELGLLGAALLSAALLARPFPARLYEGLVLLGWLRWVWHEWAGLPHGEAYVSVLWGGTAAVLLLGGTWQRASVVQNAGLAVLALFVGKLLFVDLEALSMMGRIALFLGTGAGFLLISYLLPGLGPRTETDSSASDDAPS